jgi:hypothetical protein
VSGNRSDISITPLFLLAFARRNVPLIRPHPRRMRPTTASPLAALRSRDFPLLLASAVLLPARAQAGMAMPTLTDIARARVEVLSFFLISYLVLAFIYQRLWNSLGRDLPRLPRLSYRGALCALVVCGLFIYVILTMISGARELLTPGAWARTGIKYKIREPDQEPQPWLESARRQSLERVHLALWQYADAHHGSFPSGRNDSGFPAMTWWSIDPTGLPLLYYPGLKRDDGQAILVYEPGSFGPARFVLRTDGSIVKMADSDLSSQVKSLIDAPAQSRKGPP